MSPLKSFMQTGSYTACRELYSVLSREDCFQVKSKLILCFNTIRSSQVQVFCILHAEQMSFFNIIDVNQSAEALLYCRTFNLDFIHSVCSHFLSTTTTYKQLIKLFLVPKQKLIIVDKK